MSLSLQMGFAELWVHGACLWAWFGGRHATLFFIHEGIGSG
jgi:hypothetical protein